jgi:hypothetical protein
MSTPKNRTCPTCGEAFTPTRGRRYCGRPCWPSSRPFADPDGTPEGPLTYERLIDLLWTAARRGNVSAMKVLRDEMKDDRSDEVPLSVVDELSRRRESNPKGTP